jgi:hypothetical protein
MLGVSMGSSDDSPYCRISTLMRSGFAYSSVYVLQRTSVCARTLRFCVTPHVNVFGWYGNIDPFAIAYAFRPRLRTRLTLIRLTLIRNPWAYGGQVSRLSYRYSYLHFLFQKLDQVSRPNFSAAGMLPYHSANKLAKSEASVPHFMPANFRCRIARPVSYYALFK